MDIAKTFQTVADTVSQKPEVGVFSGMVGVAVSPVQIIALVSAIIGLMIALITLTIKIIDIRAKLKSGRKVRADGDICEVGEDDYVIIGDKRYKYYDHVEE